MSNASVAGLAEAVRTSPQKNLTTTTLVTTIIPKYQNINKYNLKGG
jgi:hypothetical protein